jgi:hypothetical protein
MGFVSLVLPCDLQKVLGKNGTRPTYPPIVERISSRFLFGEHACG